MSHAQRRSTGAGPLTAAPHAAPAPAAWGQGGGGPANPQDLNRYAYGLNNPVRNTDPTGHCVWDACVVEGAALVAIATAAVWVGFQVWNTIDPPGGHQLPPSTAPASDTGGQLADPGGLNSDPNERGPEQERAVRDMLSRQYEQRYGDTDSAIRTNLGLKGRVADFVGYNTRTNRWLIAESKRSDIGRAVTQLENTMQGLAGREPSSVGRIDLRIYTSSSHYARLAGDGLGGYRVNGEGFLGWPDEAGNWIYELINSARVSIQTAP